MRLIIDSFGIRYAVERKMHREIVVYYVLALDPYGDLAASTRNRKAYARAFRHSSLELCYLSSTNASTRSWSGPIIGGAGLPQPCIG
jgi:hypothetical protein